MKLTKDELLELVRKPGSLLTLREKLRLMVLLSMPAIVAQISSTAMQIIDAAMLGHLGTRESAAVGLVSTTIWLFGGLSSAFAAGFSVQVAHKVGGNDMAGARNVIRQGFFSGIIFSLLLMSVGLSIAPFLPAMLGAGREIHSEASMYFAIVAAAMPIHQIYMLSAGSLRCSGNIKVPSMLGVMMCTLDVIFNYIYIYVLDMGTEGAAWGTFMAYLVSSVAMIYALTVKDANMRFANDKASGCKPSYKPTKKTLLRAFTIGSPISLERGVMCGAQIAISGIIAPMGSVAIAANTFGVNVESLCYMPGYGIGEAATTLVGQSMGAKRKDYMRSFAWIAMILGMGIMALMGLIMGVFSTEMMKIVTSDVAVISLGSEILKIEAWAEPMFAASIVAYSIFVGAGNTLIPSVMNLASIWGVRLTLALLLAPSMGLKGVWIAMAIELCWRGAAFIFKLRGNGWSKIDKQTRI